MGVRTTADERLNEARELIEEAKGLLNQASSKLLEVLNKDTWGSDQYKKEYKDKIKKLIAELIGFNPEL